MNQNSKVLELVVIKHGLKILLIEVFLCKLPDDDILLLGLPEPLQKDGHVGFDFVDTFSLDVSRYPIVIIQRSPPETLDESGVLRMRPIMKSLRSDLLVFIRELFRHFLHVLLQLSDLQRELLQSS